MAGNKSSLRRRMQRYFQGFIMQNGYFMETASAGCQPAAVIRHTMIKQYAHYSQKQESAHHQ
jgi:hypothetical protein